MQVGAGADALGRWTGLMVWCRAHANRARQAVEGCLDCLHDVLASLDGCKTSVPTSARGRNGARE